MLWFWKRRERLQAAERAYETAKAASTRLSEALARAKKEQDDALLDALGGLIPDHRNE